jgi:poly(hydroxyalkanoate) granule-associated protein
MPQSGIAPPAQTTRVLRDAEVAKEDPMTAKKKAKEIQNDLMDSAHKIWLAGLGAVAMAEQEGGKLFKSLIEKGQALESRGKEHVEKAKGAMSGVKTVAESYWETLERTIDDKMTGVIHRLGVPTKEEIEALTKKVQDLSTSIDKLRSEEKKTAAARPARKAPGTSAK